MATNTIPATLRLQANTAGTLITARANPNRTAQPVFAASGTFGGGTVKLQAGFYRVDNTTIDWIDITGVTLSAAGYVAVPIRPPALRAVLTGATAPDINVHFG